MTVPDLRKVYAGFMVRRPADGGGRGAASGTILPGAESKRLWGVAQEFLLKSTLFAEVQHDPPLDLSLAHPLEHTVNVLELFRLNRGLYHPFAC